MEFGPFVALFLIFYGESIYSTHIPRKMSKGVNPLKQCSPAEVTAMVFDPVSINPKKLHISATSKEF